MEECDSDVIKADLKNLLLYERELMKQQKWIEKAIENIKEQRVALQVEHMNIENMMFSETKRANDRIQSSNINNSNECSNGIDVQCNYVKETTPSIQEIDSAQSLLNSTALDLSVDELMNHIIQQSSNYSEDSEIEDDKEQL